VSRLNTWAGGLTGTVVIVNLVVLIWHVRAIESRLDETADKVVSMQDGVDGLVRMYPQKIDEDILYLKILVRKPTADKSVARKISSVVAKHAKGFNRDPNLVLAIIEVESNYLIEETSPAGAIGLMQVMPQWVEVFGIRCNLKDPDCNVQSGLRLLESYEQLYGNLKVALTVYNRGPSPVDWAFIKGQDPDNGYAGKILKAYEEIQSL